MLGGVVNCDYCLLMIPNLLAFGVGFSVGEESKTEDVVYSIFSNLLVNFMPPFSIDMGDRSFGLEYDPSRDECY